MSEPIFQIKSISKSFQEGKKNLQVLKNVSLDLKFGEVVSLLGPSGSGKSTLLHISGLLERADSGEIIIEGKATSKLSDQRRTQLRCYTIGFIYQFHHLLPEFTALENVVMPQLIKGDSEKVAKERTHDLLQKVGLGKRLTHLPSELSGGEQQRVAIARAIANKPKILLADEPTGNLDVETSSKVFEMILELAHKENMAALIVTHNPELAALTDRILTMEDGILKKTSKIKSTA